MILNYYNVLFMNQIPNIISQSNVCSYLLHTYNVYHIIVRASGMARL